MLYFDQDICQFRRLNFIKNIKCVIKKTLCNDTKDNYEVVVGFNFSKTNIIWT